MDYCGHYSLFKIVDGEFVEERPDYSIPDMYEREDRDFLECTLTGKRNRNYIDNILESAKLLDFLYQSSEQKHEISF